MKAMLVTMVIVITINTPDKKGIFDYISFPFIRQYRIADPDWFDRCDLPNVQKWLSEFEQSPLFQYVMKKMPIWKKTGKELEF